MKGLGALSALALVLALGSAAAGCALPKASRTRVDSDWEKARAIRGKDASALYSRIYGSPKLDGRDFARFFSDRVSAVREEGPAFAGCPRGAIACHGVGREIRLSRGYSVSKVPWVARISFLLHEARHAEGYSHERCPASLPAKSLYGGVPFAGEDACETSRGGPYFIQIVALRNVERFCTTCAASEKEEAGKLAQALLPLILDPTARAELEADGE